VNNRQKPLENQNEGNDGFLWSRAQALLWSLSMTVAAALLLLSQPDVLGGFIGFSG